MVKEDDGSKIPAMDRNFHTGPRRLESPHLNRK